MIQDAFPHIKIEQLYMKKIKRDTITNDLQLSSESCIKE